MVKTGKNSRYAVKSLIRKPKFRNTNLQSSSSSLAAVFNPNETMYKLMKKMDRNEFYKERVFDEDLLNESLKAVSLERDDISYLKLKLEIEDYFKKEPDEGKRK